MILGRQINSLLKRHEAVFVKGLGTFKRIHTSASFDTKRNVVLPPLNYVEFEHESSEGYDFTLYVQQSNQLSRTEAEALVQQEVEKLIDTINQDGQVTLTELGQLVSYGYTYIFKPLDLSGFQFVPLQDPYFQSTTEVKEENEVEEVENEVKEVKQEIQEAPITVVQPPVKEEVLPFEASTPPVNETLKEETLVAQEFAPKRNNGLIYGIIAALAIIILGGIYYYSIVNKNSPQVENINVLETNEAEDDSLLSVVDTSARIDSTQLALNDSTQVNQTTQTVEQDPKLDYKFTIVIGTHSKMEQADAEVAEYHKKGHTHVRVLSSNLAKNSKKVIWDAYPTKEQRDSALNFVQKNIKKDAWPFVIK